MWANNGLTIPKPGPNAQGLGAYPDISAAIYRHVGAEAGTFSSTGQLLDQSLWADPSTFYQLGDQRNKPIHLCSASHGTTSTLVRLANGPLLPSLGLPSSPEVGDC